MAHRNLKNRDPISISEYESLGADKAELGITIIGLQKNSESELARLLSYGLDASVSQDHTCYVLSRGKGMLSELRSLRPPDMYNRCLSEISNEKRRLTPLFDRLYSESMCAKPEAINSSVSILIDAINRSAHCNPEDY